MRKLIGLTLAGALLCVGLQSKANADDWGCQVLLCLSNPAGPEAVSQCVPPIERLYDTLRHHGSFPSCAQADGSASQEWASTSNCPPQYVKYLWNWEGGNQLPIGCEYEGAITVNVKGQPYSRIWWNSTGTVTEPLSTDAANSVGVQQYQADLATWQSAQAAQNTDR